MVVELHPGALEDVLAAATEYEGQSEGLGERFVAAIGDCLERLQEHPRSGALLEGAAPPRDFRSLRRLVYPGRRMMRAAETAFRWRPLARLDPATGDLGSEVQPLMAAESRTTPSSVKHRAAGRSIANPAGPLLAGSFPLGDL